MDEETDTMEEESDLNAKNLDDFLNSLSSEEKEAFSNQVFDEVIQGKLPFDNLMYRVSVGATHARKPKNYDAKHLSKIWGINLEKAKKMIDITSQHKTCTKTTHLA